MSEYGHFRVYLDPQGLVLPDGSREREIELVLSDDPDRDPPSLAARSAPGRRPGARARPAAADARLARQADRSGEPR